MWEPITDFAGSVGMKEAAQIYGTKVQTFLFVSGVASYLAVGVWVGAPHHIPLVLKDLDPAIFLAQLPQLSDPLLNHLRNGTLLHEGQGEVRVRMETHHSAETTPRMVSTRALMFAFVWC